jgi:hypothetical protein
MQQKTQVFCFRSNKDVISLHCYGKYISKTILKGRFILTHGFRGFSVSWCRSVGALHVTVARKCGGRESEKERETLRH